MNRKTPRRFLQACAAFFAWTHATASPLWALPRTWFGGSTNWNDGGNTAFWTGADEPDADDDAIFTSPDHVTLGTNNTVAALTMSGSVVLSTSGFDLTVAGLADLTGSNTSLIVGGTTTLLRADNIRIAGGATMKLTGGAITMDELGGNGLLDVAAGGSLVGFGTISLTDAPLNPTTLIINRNVISAQSDPLLPLDPPPLGTLLISATSANGHFDMDGTSGTSVVNVFRNQTLDNNLTLSDSFGGTINLFHNSTLDMAMPWTLDVGSINVSNGLAGSVPADVAFISGGTLTQTGGTIRVVDPDGALQFNAPLVQSGGSLQVSGRLIINSNSRIAENTSITGAGTLVIASGGTLLVDDGAVIDIQLRNEGVFNPSGSTTAGVVSVAGFTQTAGGRVHIQLGGPAAQDSDQLIIDGPAIFAGELRVGRINSFIPEPGDAFTTVSYLSQTGSLSIINETGIAGLTFTPSYGSTALTLTATALLPGDANLNGRVDVIDLLALANHWLSSADWFGGDFDGSGFVDPHDLGILAMNWQTGILAPSFAETADGLGLSVSNVPEPSIAASAWVGLLTLPRRRRR